MNKKELVESIAKKTSITKTDVEKCLNATIQSIMDGVKGDDMVQLVGFGSFVKRERKAREGRNPQTGKTIKIKAKTVVGFKSGKSFKEFLNEKKSKTKKKTKKK